MTIPEQVKYLEAIAVYYLMMCQSNKTLKCLFSCLAQSSYKQAPKSFIRDIFSFHVAREQFFLLNTVLALISVLRPFALKYIARDNNECNGWSC